MLPLGKPMNEQANPLSVDPQNWYGPEARAALVDRLDEVSAQVRTLVMQHPVAAVGSAMTLGFLVARMFRR
jgi:hypothetical protein